MTDSTTHRSLILTFEGEGFGNGKVPVTILASKLEALQNLVFHAAATAIKDKLARRGQWTNRHRNSSELIFVSSHHSDLEITAELPSANVLGRDFDTGLKAIDLIFSAGAAIESNGGLDDLVPDRQERAFILRGFEALSPGTADDYRVGLSNCTESHPRLNLSRETRSRIKKIVVSEAERDATETTEATVVGSLTKIHVDVGPPFIAVQSNGVEINCYYDDILRDQISNLLAGSTVEVTGLASFSSDGNIKQIDKILDVELVSMEPLRIGRFEFQGLRYKLHEPLRLLVEYSDRLWSYRCDELNLWGYGERREEAIRDLHGNFDYLWREFALEKDERLDAKAVEIKTKLLALVANSEGSDDAA